VFHIIEPKVPMKKEGQKRYAKGYICGEGKASLRK
jgi:hypothetical protein